MDPNEYAHKRALKVIDMMRKVNDSLNFEEFVFDFTLLFSLNDFALLDMKKLYKNYSR